MGEIWTKYDLLFQHWASFFGIPWQWLKAIAIVESTLGLDPRVKQGLPSRDGKSFGLMQLTPQTATWRAGRTVTPDDLKNDDLSIELSASLLGHLNKVFNGDEREIIMAYNEGEGNVEKGVQAAAGYYRTWKIWYDLIMQGHKPE